MINLLPPEMKQSYRYARRNRQLVFWSAAFLVAITGVAILTGSGLAVMNRSINTHKTDIAAIETRLTSQNLSGTKKEVTAISTNLNLMVGVLSKQVLFSELLTQLANITPPNVILTNLSISQTVSAIDVTARATDYNSAAQLQTNLADPNNKIFSSADIVDINCSGATAEGNAATYPCTVTIKALFVSDNPFLFINTNKVGQ
jgi:Tfp pilus assembly protein PilN